MPRNYIKRAFRKNGRPRSQIREWLAEVNAGTPPKAIAARARLSPQTVRNYVRMARNSGS